MDKTAIRCDKNGSCGARGSVTELIVCNSELDVADDGLWMGLSVEEGGCCDQFGTYTHV
jgi:hypothetical protein